MNSFLIRIILLLSLAGTASQAVSQKYFTRSGQVSFYSDAPLEKIEAHNNKATSVIDFTTGQMEWAVLIKAFQFKKALMQEHFNENYMESSIYPKAVFKGKILNMDEIDISTENTYEAEIEGIIEIHGVKQSLTTSATLQVGKESIRGSSKFNLTVKDFDIKIPGVVRDNIANEVEVTVLSVYQKLDKKS